MAESSQSNLCPSSEPAPKSNVLRRYMVAVQDAGLALMGNHAGLHPKGRPHIGAIERTTRG
ncbi:MAG TPA: hypothetical protein VIK32_10225 [Candidatus Limnocylindrales bacterium]